MPGFEHITNPEFGEKKENVNERADVLVKTLLGAFAQKYHDQLRQGNRGIVEQDMKALIDRTLTIVRNEEGEEFAEAVGRRFVDEIEFCSAAFEDFVDAVKEVVADSGITLAESEVHDEGESPDAV